MPDTAHAMRLLTSAPFRLALTALSIVMPAAAIFAAFVGWQVNLLLTDRTLEVLRGELQYFRSELDRGGTAALATAVSDRSAVRGSGLYRLSIPSGTKITVGNLATMPEGVTADGNIFQVWSDAEKRYYAAAGLVVSVPGGGQLLVARGIEDQRTFAANLQRTAFAGVGLLTFIALVLGWSASRRTNRRVSDVTTTARSIMAGDFSRRIPRDQSGDEFDHLASSLNEMLARIEDLMQALREVSDNIAHDLKTPLTRLRNRAEAALRDDSALAHRDGLERVIEEADGLIQTFNALLLIARLEVGAVDATRSVCEIASLVRDVAELYQPVADEAGLEIKFVGNQPVPLAVNRQLIGQAVANMLDNAIKYSSGSSIPSSGPVIVTVAPQADNGVEIAVADRGPGIPAVDRERATKRFVRLEQSRSRPGSGLGLSLVAAVARLHGGRVRLEDNEPGLRIVMSLPQLEQNSATVNLPGASARAGQSTSVSG